MESRDDSEKCDGLQPAGLIKVRFGFFFALDVVSEVLINKIYYRNVKVDKY